MAAKERHRLVDGLEQTAGLRLERERDAAVGVALDLYQMGDVPNQQIDDPLDCLGRGGIGLERPRYGADAAERVAAGRQQRCHQVRKLVGIFEPSFIAPVGQVDLLLDRLAVERPIGKAVDGEDVQIVRAQKADELCQASREQSVTAPLRPRGAVPLRKARPGKHGA